MQGVSDEYKKAVMDGNKAHKDYVDGKITLNQARAIIGLPPYSFPEADMLYGEAHRDG